MRDRRLVVDAVARPELVLDAVDGEDERAREDVRELLALVGVVVSRIARLAGCDGDEQWLERSVEAGRAQQPVCVRAADRQARVSGPAHVRSRHRLGRRGEEHAHVDVEGDRERVQGRE